MFVVENQDHLQMIEICAELQRLSVIMCDTGLCLIQNLFCMMWNKKKLCFICHQSEKLAIGLRLIKPAPCTPLQIRKHLQVFLKIATLPQSSFFLKLGEQAL